MSQPRWSVFQPGEYVVNAVGDTFRVMWQHGCMVFVGPNVWFHPTKLWRVTSPW